MQKSVLRIPTESGKANISYDAHSTELFGINICDFRESSSVEDGMADAYLGNAIHKYFVPLFSTVFQF